MNEPGAIPVWFRPDLRLHDSAAGPPRSSEANQSFRLSIKAPLEEGDQPLLTYKVLRRWLGMKSIETQWIQISKSVNLL